MDGLWWLPSAPERAVGGRFTFRRDQGPHLQILGELLSSEERAASTGKIPIVLGSVAGTDLTLLDLNLGKAHFSIGRRYFQQEYRPELAVVGAHLDGRDGLRSDRWQVQFSQLAEWLESGGFAVELGEDVSENVDFLYRVTYKPVELPPLSVRDITLKFAFATSAPFGPVGSLNLSETPYADVTLPEAMHFDSFRSGALWQLQNFLTLATDRKNTVEAVFMKTSVPSESLEVLYQSRFESDAAADPWTMLFPYARVADCAEAVISRWLDIYEKLGPPLNSMFSVVYGNIRATDTKFLNIVQAAESYHRRMYPPTDDERISHAARVERVLTGTPQKDIEWLTGKLANSGEPFLTERLVALFDRLGGEFLQPMFSSRKAMKSGAWLIADWRNKLTHMRATPAEIAEGLFAIHVCTNQLLITLKANLLLDLGFERTDIISSFKYSDIYNYFAHHEKS